MFSILLGQPRYKMSSTPGNGSGEPSGVQDLSLYYKWKYNDLSLYYKLYVGWAAINILSLIAIESQAIPTSNL